MADEKKQGLPLYPQLPPSAPNAYPMGPAYQHPQGPPPPYSMVAQPGAYIPAQGHAMPAQGQFNFYPQAPQSQPMNYPQYAPNTMPQGHLPGHFPGATGQLQHGLYAAGARFGQGGGAPVIPPPPPGYAPNPVQAAVMQGQAVVMDKQKNDFLTGGKGAGYTFL